MDIQQIQDSFPNRVIHQAVKMMLPYPTRVSVPNLSQQIGFSVRCSNHMAKLSPKSIIINFVWHIQTPTIGPLFDPITSDIEDIVSHSRVVGIKFW